MTKSIPCLVSTVRVWTVLFVCLLGLEIQAQDCDTRIEDAQHKYDLGQFQEALNLVESCTGNPDLQIQWKSLRMQAICYLALKENDKARSAAVKMLRINPRYVSSPINDPGDLIRLLDDIYILPKFSFGLSLSVGSNYTNPQVSNIHLMAPEKKTYTGQGALQFGISSVYQLNRQFALEAELKIQERRFKIDYTSQNWDFGYQEKLNYLSLPLGLRYYLPGNKNLKAFVKGGTYVSRLIFSENSLSANNRESAVSYDLLKASSKPRRNNWELGAILGIGAVQKIGNGQLFAEFYYQHSFNTINNPDNRNDFAQLQSDYLYLEDDITLHNFAFNFGYRLHLKYEVLE